MNEPAMLYGPMNISNLQIQSPIAYSLQIQTKLRKKYTWKDKNVQLHIIITVINIHSYLHREFF